MEWAILLLIAAIVLVHWWEYRHAVQEYTFAAPATIEKHDELRGLLSEKTPLAVEIGPLPWRPEVVEKSPWRVRVEGAADGTTEMEIPTSEWVKQSPRADIRNGPELAEEMGLTTGLADLDESRAWWWLPGLRDATVDVLAAGDVVGLQWVSGERQWVGCTHGGPLTLWLVHSRYRRYLPAALSDGGPVDPWKLTVAEAPWIGRVQFVEVTVKPGWCMGLPAHWGFAVRSDAEAWWWSARQESTLSWCLNNTGRILSHTESLN
jgi:hypothetical protein